MSSPSPRREPGRTTDIDDLLERVRTLQRLLPTPERQRLLEHAKNADVSRDHRFCSRAPRSRSHSGGDKRRQRTPPPLPTRDDEQPATTTTRQDATLTNAEADGDNGSDVGVTLDLLQQVTFVRVVVDSLTWHKPPALLAQEFSRNLSPRDKSQLFVEYQFPAGCDDFETLKRRVRAVARTTLPSVAHFNHRRVALVKITPSLVSTWSKSCLWLRIGYQTPGSGKYSVRHLGKCYLPLHQLLSVPFDVAKALPIEPLHGYASSGTLKVSVQLGSRLPSFSDKIDPLRSPRRTNGAVRPIKSVDVSLLERRLAELNVNSGKQHDTRIFGIAGRKTQLNSQEESQKSSGSALTDIRPRLDLAARRASPPYVGVELPAVSSTPTPPPPSHEQRHARFSHAKQSLWSSSVQRESARGAVTDVHELEPRHGSYFRNENRDAGNEDTARHRHIDAPSSPTYPETEIKTLSHQRLKEAAATSCDGVTRQHRARPLATTESVDGGPGGRTTVAERLRRTSRGAEEDEGQWLRLTVASAARLPLVKSPGGQPILPRVFVSYRGNERLESSNVVENTANPVWNWTTQLFVKPDRKNVVLKLWHRCPEKGDKVLGFVALDLPQSRLKVEKTGDYDLVDLSQSSTGTVRISIQPLPDVEAEETPNLMTSFFEQPGSAERCRLAEQDEKQKCSSGNKATNTSILMNTDDQPLPQPRDRYMEMASRSFLVEKLRVNINELDDLMRHLPSR